MKTFLVTLLFLATGAEAVFPDVFLTTGSHQATECASACEDMDPRYTSGCVTEAQEAEIQNLLTARSTDSTSAFIGINDMMDEGGFVCADTGLAPAYLKWNSGEPNEAGEEDCVETIKGAGWNDISCTTSRWCACTPKVVTAVTTFEPTTGTFKYADCSTACSDMSSSPYYYTFTCPSGPGVSGTADRSWIAISDVESEGTFKCEGGNNPSYNPSYLNWNTGEPNNAGLFVGEDCVDVDQNGFYNDLPCTNEIPCMCEKHYIPYTPETPSFGGDGSTGAICFTGESQLTLKDGSTKTFHEIKVGDEIMGADRDGKISYSPVIFTPHPFNNITRQFDEVKTMNGKVLRMTRNHLIPLCDGSLVTARSLKNGDCVLTKDGEDKVSTTAPNVEAAGIYTAVTKNEFLVVDGVVASPFALAHGIAHSLFDRDDVNEWCKDNSHLLPIAADEEVQEQVSRRRLSGGDGTSGCVDLVHTLFDNYKDQGVGWGTNGFGYKNFKTLRGGDANMAKKQASLPMRLSGFLNHL